MNNQFIPTDVTKISYEKISGLLQARKINVYHPIQAPQTIIDRLFYSYSYIKLGFIMGVTTYNHKDMRYSNIDIIRESGSLFFSTYLLLHLQQ